MYGEKIVEILKHIAQINMYFRTPTSVTIFNPPMFLSHAVQMNIKESEKEEKKELKAARIENKLQYHGIKGLYLMFT